MELVKFCWKRSGAKDGVSEWFGLWKRSLKAGTMTYMDMAPVDDLVGGYNV